MTPMTSARRSSARWDKPPQREGRRLGRKLMTITLIMAGIITALVLLVWLGLRVQPAAFPALVQTTPVLETVPLPEGLPVPVERFYRQLYGENVPVITSAVISGRAEMRPVGNLTLPGRFRFIHDAGQAYRHYMEATFFGLPIMRVNEHFLDGQARLELPFGVEEDSYQLDQGANLGLWAESLWLPSIFLTDPRVHWEPVDEVTALLVVPFAEAEERFVVRFDPDTGLPFLFESMRYKGADSERKVLWLNEALEWGTVNGHTVPTAAALTWLDDGRPWAVFAVEEVVYNVEVHDYIRAKGP